MRGARWIVGLGALALAGAAVYVLLAETERPRPSLDAPAMDEIDAESRRAMRELLREAEQEE